ncbi:M3 family oligoendopeptidase [Paracrocinitomix mangrovi]|uniref:M3 family oligoendopeptidase n=1 Tax=Paracrocinitomix mangrovi TaxID=2862509 RepID=UPI001C8EB4FA|nr:M3 family oligoendopeptidase [Paracrocinitomix mangrovi]UKN02586.1 M3 family oligoendopeptidase [Paracrocinitomix mangrovi]
MEVKRKPRRFVAEDLVINNWTDIKPYFDQLLNAEINSVEDFKDWLLKNSELEAVLEEDMAWRYIKMTIDTANQEAAERYKKFVTEINPPISEASNILNQKLANCPFKDELKSEADQIYFKKVETAIELFREENIPLQSKSQTLAQEYSGVIGAQLITYNGKELTSQQAAKFLKNPDRTIRKEVYDLLYDRRIQDNEKLEEIFDELVKTRHEIATNAGFDNYRDYKFKAMNRFDYSVQDCFDFHQSVEDFIVPIHRKIQQEKLNKFGFEKFKPYDTNADPEGKAPLEPFKNGKELLNKSIEIFGKIDPYFADCLETMDEIGHLDLESKKGKAPGGYNYPLYEIGIPFIFMNAAGSSRDVITMIHEGGHAVHSFLTKDLNLTSYKSFPSEVAELASMSMELLSMKYWEVFYDQEDELKRAKKEHLEDIIMVLPWVATIDAFQHWIYENPEHTREQRKSQWLKLSDRFGTGLTDWDGYEQARDYAWHKQLHLFEVPFYYIEYGFSQLGALGVWKNSLADEKKAVDQYKGGLALGYTKDIKSIYSEAGVKFDFSSGYIKELSEMLVDQLNKI